MQTKYLPYFRLSSYYGVVFFLCQEIYCHYMKKRVIERQTRKEKWEFCSGVFLSPKGRKKTPCDQSFNITVDIKYKNDKAGGGGQSVRWPWFRSGLP